jgi:ribosomal-protein-alanine N-acetyltransferase
VVRLRERAGEDPAWYAGSVRDPLIQRFTTESPAPDAGLVLAAIAGLRVVSDAEGFVICDVVTGEGLGNMALRHDGRTGEVSYWVAAGARGRGVAARALAFSARGAFR